MSSFSGLVAELPGISVDRFLEDNLNKSTAFFLTHCHTDHMQGLSPEFFEKIAERSEFLYCSPLTKTFLVANWQLSPELKNRIVAISGCSQIIVTYKNPEIGATDELVVGVTAVPAGHCPGSVMFLFEGTRNDRSLTILCTGDFRINPEDFPILKPLNDRLGGKLFPKKFDNVYLDTTFYDENIKYLPTRKEALVAMIPIIKDWLNKNEKNVVVLEISANYGYEHLFIELSRTLNQRIHVKSHVEGGYRFIPEFNRFVTNDPYETRIHACMAKRYKNVLTCRSPAIDPENILTIIPSVQRWIFEKKDLTRAFTEFDEKNQRFYVCYSCHASYSELRRFIEYFNPIKVYPCVLPKNLSVEEMQNKIMGVCEAPREVKYCFVEERPVKRQKIKKFSDEVF